jgi:PAS domain S-box-containing protein
VHRRRLHPRLTVIGHSCAVIAIAIVLVLHGVEELDEPSARDIVLGWTGFLAAPVLCLLAWRVSSEARRIKVCESADARRLAGAEKTGQELIWETTSDGTVTYVNAVSRKLIGYDPAELIGQSAFFLLPPCEQDRARAELADAVRDRRGWAGLTLQVAHADGLAHWMETSGVPNLDARGTVVGFTATMRRLDSEAITRIQLERTRQRVQGVLDNRSIRTLFQPIVNLRTGRTAGYEALSRFTADPAQPPDRWFADAQTIGLGIEVECLAVETALVAAEELPRGCYLSVNASPATLASGRLIPILDGTPLDGRQLVIEITEHVTVDNYQALRQPLETLRARGIRIAVDDAGAGYASFRHILRLRPECIKLDRDIIRDLDQDPARRALAAALVMFAQDVGATVTAEGVETPEELDTLSRLGFDAAQGYLLGRPSTNVQRREQDVIPPP